MFTRIPSLQSGVGSRRFLALLCGLCMVLGAASAWCQDPLVLEFPLKDEVLPPAGLVTPAAETQVNGHSIIEIPFTPVNQDTNVYVTIVFREEPGAVLQASWIGTGHRAFEKVLSNNIMEGIQGWNQRTLAIPYGLISDFGSLVITSNSGSHTIKRIAIAWAVPNITYSSGEGQNAEYIQSSRKVFSESSFIDAKPGSGVQDTWVGEVAKAGLQDGVEGMDNGVELVMTLDSQPRFAVFRAKFLGADIDGIVEITVNGKRLLPVTLETPDLTDPGYMEDYTGNVSYAGWREASIRVPSGLLRNGENSIIVESMAGVYIKNSLLEVKFDHPPQPTGYPASAAPPDLSLPVDALAPTTGQQLTSPYTYP